LEAFKAKKLAEALKSQRAQHNLRRRVPIDYGDEA
jgi:hypothetical protein